MSDENEFEGKSVDEAVDSGLAHLGLTREEVSVEVIRKGSRGLLGFGSESALVRIEPNNRSGISSAGDSSPDTSTERAEDPQFDDDVAPSSEASAENSSDDSDSSAAPDSSKHGDSAASTGNAQPATGSESADDGLDDEQELTSIAVDFLEELVYLMGYDAEVNATWKEPEPDETESCLMLSVDGEDLDGFVLITDLFVRVGNRFQNVTSAETPGERRQVRTHRTALAIEPVTGKAPGFGEHAAAIVEAQTNNLLTCWRC